MAPAPPPPEGTIALLFTDIEGSTRLAAELGPAWPGVLAEHHGLITGAISAEGGFVDGTEGDAFFVTFTDAKAAARCAVTALRCLRAHPWPAEVGELRVRMGLHVGYVERTATGYVGLEVHRAARVAAAAHGGQLLMTSAARELAGTEVDTEALGAHRLKDFPAPELLFCAVVDGRGAAFFPPPRTAQIRPTNLPAGLRPLVGRKAELEQIWESLTVGGERLVTLTGRGGAGKTSLALTAAAGLLDEHPAGVWLARLATIASPDEVMPAIAAAMNGEGGLEAQPLEAIAQRLADRGPALIVLDNFEHLLAAASQVSELVARVPTARVLVTSQAPLRISGELCLAIDALDDASGRELIGAAARRRSSATRLVAEDEPALSEIVALLDGLPLALELAAARLAMLTPHQLRDRLRNSIDLLRDDSRDRSERHRSLRATVDWTLGLLEAPPRQLFVRLGVFAGPVELDQIEAISGADGLGVIDALSALLDVALVRRVESGDGRIRFGLPEALRQIAVSLLNNEPDGDRWRREHAAYQRQVQWAARNRCVSAPVFFAASHGRVEALAAVRWARERNDPLAAPIAVALAMLLVTAGRLREAADLIAPVLRSPASIDPAVRGHAQLANAVLLMSFSQRPEALAAADAALHLLIDPESRATAFAVRGLTHLTAGDLGAAVADHARATAIARTVGPVVVSEALRLEAQARMEAGQLDLAAELLDEAWGAGEQGNSPHLWARHSSEGDLAVLRGQARQAAQHYVQATEAAQREQDDVQVANDLAGVASALTSGGHYAEALEVIGMADGQFTDSGGTLRSLWGFQADLHREAEELFGPELAAEAKRRGRAVPAGYRVTRAAQLARSAFPE